MAELDDFDLDRTTRRAWRRFQERLADHIVGMVDDDVLLVEAESTVDGDAPGAAPYAQLCAWGDDLVRAEISSNAYLAEGHQLDAAAAARVVELGWAEPTHGSDDEPDEGSANFFIDLERRDADRLAAMTVAVLRDVFGVAHPAFLTSPDMDVAGDARPSADAGHADQPLAVMPESHEHLWALVDAALARPDGSPLEHDENGDIPLPYGSALIYVRVSDVAPVVEVYSMVVIGVEDLDRAAHEIVRLNRDNPLVKFLLFEDFVVARCDLLSAPFAPAILRATLPWMADVVDRIDDELVAVIGGRRACDPVPADTAPSPAPTEQRIEQLHPALMTLMQLDPPGAGVEPDLAASICDDDRDLALQLLRQASEQEVEWRKAGDAALIKGDSEAADACFHAGRAWQAAVDTLRRALRVIVAREHATRSSRRATYGSRPATGRRGSGQRPLFGWPSALDEPAQQSLFDVDEESWGEDVR